MVYIFEKNRDNGGPALVGSGLDYVAECDKTASGVFRCDHVGQAELAHALKEFIEASWVLNKFKKAMFRQQSREEAGLSVVDDYGDDPLDNLVAGMALDDLIHGIIGVCTEAGEAAEILARLLNGERPDVTNVREETGDLLWYLSRLVKWADTTFLTEMKRNISKLRARHGAAGFNKERDMHRNLDAEHDVLDGGCICGGGFNTQCPVHGKHQ